MISAACDLCGKVKGDVKRYGLQRREREDGYVKSWGRGGIDLCDDCWKRVAEPHMVPGRNRSLGRGKRIAKA